MQSNLRAPLAAGTRSGGQFQNYGYIPMVQRAIINQNGTAAVSATLRVPHEGPQFYTGITDIWVDMITPFNSATSAILSIGKTAGGTQFVSGLDVKAGTGRIRPTWTSAQLNFMQNVGQDSIVITVTVVGATTAGQVIVGVEYLVGGALQPVITL